MPKQQSKKIEEELFRILERSKPYKDMEMFIRKILLEQWNDVLYSGIINKMFNNYKRFFVRRRGKKQKIRKAVGDEVGSEEELKEAEKETLQADRFMVGEMAIKMLPFLLFLGNSVGSSMKSFSSYYGFNKEFRDYLRITSNIAGQTIIDQIPLPKPIKFRLSNRALKAKIAERVDELVKGLNKTTKNTLTKQLALGIKKGETKTKLLKRMQSKGVQVAKMRAKRIIATETEAIAEYMRYETARLNGVVTKTWETAGDERVCFLANTQVTTDKGEKGIQKIKKGDKVLTRQGYKKVIATNKREYKGKMTVLKTKDSKLISTYDHPIWKVNSGWLFACDFNVGDFVKSSQDNDIKVIKVKTFIKEYSQYVYDIQVAECPEFYANSILVHNCPICAPLDGVSKKMNQKFESGDFSGLYPGAHPVCRCTVAYDVSGNLASNFIKARGLNRIDELVRKAKQGNLYKPIYTINRGIVNPNAVWAGGESLVGRDKDIRNIFEGISYAREITKDRLYEEAKEKLTLEGMVQLRNMLGLSPNVKQPK